MRPRPEERRFHYRDSSSAPPSPLRPIYRSISSASTIRTASAAEYWAMRRGGHRDHLRHRLRQLLAAAVRRRGHLRQELQGQDPGHRGHRLAVERQRPRLGRHHPDRQPHRRRQKPQNSRSISTWRSTKGLGSEHARHSISLGVGNRRHGVGPDAVVRRGRRAAAQDHRPGQGLRSACSTACVVGDDPAARAAAERKRKLEPRA